MTAIAAIKNEIKNKFKFNVSDNCSLLITSSLHAIEIIVSEIKSIRYVLKCCHF